MALVVYEVGSDEESTDDETHDGVKLNGTCVLLTPSDIKPNTDQSASLFANLSQPTASNKPKDVDDGLLHKEEIPEEMPNKRVKISIPSLSAYSSDEDEGKPPDKKEKTSVSGLLSILPPPKFAPLSNTSFVPNVIQKKVKKPAPELTMKKPLVEKGKKVIIDSDSDDEGDIDFVTYNDEMWEEACGKKKKVEVKISPEQVMEKPENSIVAAPEVEKPYSGLDNEAFKKLVGSSKRIPENIKIVDIHEDEIRPDKEVWLKSLTDPNFDIEPVIENTVDNTRKAKNHITALAQKALSSDKELQAQWSDNRFKRKQTQAKYGF